MSCRQCRENNLFADNQYFIMTKYLFFLGFVAIFLAACNSLTERSSPAFEPPRMAVGEPMTISSSDIERMQDTVLRDFLLAQIEAAELKDSFSIDTVCNKKHVHLSAGDLLGTGNRMAFLLYAQNEKNDIWEARIYTWHQQKRRYISGGSSASGLWATIKANKVEIAFNDLNRDGLKDIYLPSAGDWGQVFLATTDGSLQLLFDYSAYFNVIYADSSKTYKGLRNYNCPEGTKPTDKKNKAEYVPCACEFNIIQADGRWDIKEIKRDCPCK